MDTAGILALDLATWTGWAHWKPGMDRPRSGVLRLPKTGEDVGRFVNHYTGWLSGFLDLERPRYVVFEAPFVGERTSQEVARKLLGLAVVTEQWCYSFKESGADCRYLETNNQNVRTHFLGSGSRGAKFARDGEDLRSRLKRMTVENCNAKGWDVDDDNEADALAVLDFAAWTLKSAIDVPWDARPASGPQLAMRVA